MTPDIRKRWLIRLLVVGIPCLAVQTVHQVAASRRQSAIERCFQELSLAQANLEKTRTSDLGSDAVRDGEQSLADAMSACHHAIQHAPLIRDWLRVPASIGFFFAFWGIVILAFKGAES